MMGKRGQHRLNGDKESTKTSPTEAKNNWLHPPDALQRGHIAYLVKFLGSTEVEQAKGIEVVKEGIRKLKFNQQLKKAEGTKTPKVELTVSIDGVAIHEPKTKKNLHQYPLHRISYCADDKAEKRFFSFIAKEAESDKHTCYVFVSDKLAEEITLTIGQAFDLAYRRFTETSGRELELRRQLAALQRRISSVEEENVSLKSRLTHLAALKNRDDVDQYMLDNNISDLLMLNGESSSDPPSPPTSTSSSSTFSPPPVPPRNILLDESNCFMDDILSGPGSSSDGDDDFDPRAEEKVIIDSLSFSPEMIGNGKNEDDFDPRAEEKNKFSTLITSPVVAEMNGFTSPPLIPPPLPLRTRDQVSPKNDGSENIYNTKSDPFGSLSFSPVTNNNDILAQFNEMKAGFSRGLSFGTADEEFTLDSLDPLKN